MGAGTSHYILLGLYFNVYYYIPFIFTFANMDFLKVTFAVTDREFGIHVLQRSFTTLFADMSTKRLGQQQVYESFLRSQIHFLFSRKLGGGWGKGGTLQDFRWYTHAPFAINTALLGNLLVCFVYLEFQLHRHILIKLFLYTITVELAPIKKSSLCCEISKLRPTFVEASIARAKSAISAGIQCPYFEAQKKQHGLFKSTENHILACSLHLHLNAPLIRFKKHLHLTWF